MISYKTPKEIATMQTGGKILKEVADAVVAQARPGITTLELDAMATKLLKEKGGDISFATVEGYHWATCTPINEQVVHTPPSQRVLKEGDILTLDIGILYQGLHVDYATSVYIGKQEPNEIKKFLDTGREAVEKALRVVRPGGYLGEISKVLQETIETNGYFILKELTGHGIGKELHEEPYVFCFLDRPVEKTLKLKPGLTIAIEVMYSMGTEEIAYEPGNAWSIISADRSLTACFEKSVAIGENNAILLT